MSHLRHKGMAVQGVPRQKQEELPQEIPKAAPPYDQILVVRIAVFSLWRVKTTEKRKSITEFLH
jgi:hypothetical protein